MELCHLRATLSPLSITAGTALSTVTSAEPGRVLCFFTFWVSEGHLNHFTQSPLSDRKAKA